MAPRLGGISAREAALATTIGPESTVLELRPELRPIGFLSDSALAGLVAAGDARAFEVLFERFQPEIFRYCAAIVRNRQDAEEAFQHTMLNAFRGLRASGGRQIAVRAWLYRIAHNECVNVLRARPRSEVLDEGLDAAASGALEDQVEAREDLRQLRADLESLPSRQRSALVLRELSGLGHADIGHALGTTAADARRLVHEARVSLSEYAAGRDLPCREVCDRIADGDRRALKARSIKAHLRECQPCAAFAAEQDERRRRFGLFLPALPAIAAAGVLQSSIRGGGGTAGLGGASALAGGGGGSSSAGAGGAPGGGGGAAGAAAGAAAAGGIGVAGAIAAVAVTATVVAVTAGLIVTTGGGEDSADSTPDGGGDGSGGSPAGGASSGGPQSPVGAGAASSRDDPSEPEPAGAQLAGQAPAAVPTPIPASLGVTPTPVAALTPPPGSAGGAPAPQPRSAPTPPTPARTAPPPSAPARGVAPGDPVTAPVDLPGAADPAPAAPPTPLGEAAGNGGGDQTGDPPPAPALDPGSGQTPAEVPGEQDPGDPGAQDPGEQDPGDPGAQDPGQIDPSTCSPVGNDRVVCFPIDCRQGQVNCRPVFLPAAPAEAGEAVQIQRLLEVDATGPVSVEVDLAERADANAAVRVQGPQVQRVTTRLAAESAAATEPAPPSPSAAPDAASAAAPVPIAAEGSAEAPEPIAPPPSPPAADPAPPAPPPAPVAPSPAPVAEVTPPPLAPSASPEPEGGTAAPDPAPEPAPAG